MTKVMSSKVQFKSFMSEVDIIVPFHGQYEKCTKLVESILRFTKSGPFKLCLVDDASPNENYIEMVRRNLANSNEFWRANGRSERDMTKCVRLSEQRGFGGAALEGYRNTSSPYVCIVQSDCLIEDINWLKNMGESLLKLKEQGVRMVSSRTNNPMGGSEYQQGAKGDVKEDVILKDGDYLSLHCFICHRELFNRVGGFIRSYPYGGYEDQEFAYRLKKHGFKQAVSGKSWVNHEGGETFKYLIKRNPDVQNIVESNAELCLQDMKK